MNNIIRMLQRLNPIVCYRKYYTMDKFDKPCKCLVKCKYPPPSTLAYEPMWNKKMNNHYKK